MEAETAVTLMFSLQLLAVIIAVLNKETRTPKKIAKYSTYPPTIYLGFALLYLFTGIGFDGGSFGSHENSQARIYIPIALSFLVTAGYIFSGFIYLLAAAFIKINASEAT